MFRIFAMLCYLTSASFVGVGLWMVELEKVYAMREAHAIFRLTPIEHLTFVLCCTILGYVLYQKSVDFQTAGNHVRGLITRMGAIGLFVYSWPFIGVALANSWSFKFASSIWYEFGYPFYFIAGALLVPMGLLLWISPEIQKKIDRMSDTHPLSGPVG